MNNQICKVHNELVLHSEQDAQQNQIFLCKLCLQLKFKIEHIDNVDNEEKQALKQLEIKFDQNIKQLEDFAQVLELFTQQILQKLKKFKHLVEQSIQHIIEKKNQVKNISNDFTNLQLIKIYDQKNALNTLQAQIISQLNNQIKELEISTRLNQLYQSIEYQLQQQNDIKNDRVIQKKFEKQDYIKFDKKFDYRLMQKSSLKQNEDCKAIAFNKDATIMIVGCKYLIKVFEFQNHNLRKLQQLNGHSTDVLCLKFMNKLKQFISGSEDLTIIIWEYNQNNQWQCNQILKNHKSSIYSIIMNQNEDLLISGSGDKTIKFWQKQTNTWSCNQSIDCQSYVYSISLNDKEDKLIASVYEKQILVIQQQGEVWIIKQKISVEQNGLRLCYSNDNQFVFQPFDRNYLQIFDYDVKEQTFKQEQVLEYQNKENGDKYLFPIQYISQIQLIIVKNGCYVHLVKRNQSGQFTVEQSIDFNTQNIYGCKTDDGRYFATWDDKSKEIQIRKFEFG